MIVKLDPMVELKKIGIRILNLVMMFCQMNLLTWLALIFVVGFNYQKPSPPCFCCERSQDVYSSLRERYRTQDVLQIISRSLDDGSKFLALITFLYIIFEHPPTCLANKNLIITPLVLMLFHQCDYRKYPHESALES